MPATFWKSSPSLFANVVGTVNTRFTIFYYHFPKVAGIYPHHFVWWRLGPLSLEPAFHLKQKTSAKNDTRVCDIYIFRTQNYSIIKLVSYIFNYL